MKITTNSGESSTTDLGLASTLVTLGFLLERLDRGNPSRVQFVFRADPEVDKAVQAYWDGQLEVDPQAYFNNTKRIKSQLYSGIGNADR